MKKFIMTFLVAGLIITSVLSLGSCKKTDTNASAGEWIPTTYDFVMKDNPLLRDATALCPYDAIPVNLCNHGIQWWSYDTNGEQIICPDGPYDPEHNPNGHYHEHWFSPEDDCTPPAQTNYICPHKGGRNHRHIVVYWQQGWDNHWHLGGSAVGE